MAWLKDPAAPRPFQMEEAPAIGTSIAEAASGFARCRRMLGEILDGRRQELVQSALAELDNAVFKIVVIGQTKAGKSSLINAMIKRPDFLPTDPNPWTSVATRLHFGRSDEVSEHMVFHFFTSEEWQELAEGGGPLASMIERVAPGSERDELIRQLALIRRRAERRLGPSFHHLLGKRHRFSKLSIDVLERYVSSGNDVDRKAAQRTPGWYADITKLADLALDKGPFAWPITIVDTPGINDPLLIRDEMTHRHLADADLCLVVLNAQQALATADVDLMRLLHGQHRGRIAIFVNRIDLLSGVVENTEKVVESIRERLKQDFASHDIPIVTGSARWGEYSEQLIANDIQPLTTPALTEMSRHLGAVDQGEPASWIRSRTPDLRRIRGVLRRCSGLPDLRATIGDLLDAEPARLAVERAGAALGSVIRSAETESQNELRALSMLSEAITGDKRVVLGQLTTIQRDFHQIEELRDRLCAVGDQFQQDMVFMTQIGLQRLRVRLDGVVDAYAEAEGHRLAEALKPMPRVWRCDINPLRQALAREFLVQYRLLVDQLAKLQNEAVATARSKLGKDASYDTPELGYQQPHLVDPSPSIAALGQAIALDLGRPWMEWWKRWRESANRANKLRGLIRTEFRPVVAKLVAAARDELDAHVDMVARGFKSELDVSITTLRHREKQFAKVYVDMLEKRGQRPSEETLSGLQPKTASHNRRLDHLRHARRQMESAMAVWRGRRSPTDRASSDHG